MSWIASVPKGWKRKRLKYLGTARNGLTFKPENVTDKGILVLRSSNIQGNELAFDDNVYVDMRIPRKIVLRENDLLICSRNGSRTLIGKCALINEETAGNTYGAFMCVYRSEYNRFIRYVMLSDIFGFYLSSFLTATINQLTNENLLDIEILFPPEKEQQVIVSFLDERCCQIDDIITDMERQVKLLRKYKKALVTETVTKGLNNSVKMKDSCIEWIGEIPEHWKTANGKVIFEIFGGSISDNDMSLIPVEKWHKILYFKVDDMNATQEGFEMEYDKELIFTPRKNKPLNSPLILVPKRGAAIYTNKVRITNVDCCIDPNIMAIAINENIRYYAYLIFGRSLADIGDVSTIPQINNKHVNYFKVPIPTLSEQQAIANFLDGKCAEINNLINEKLRSIDTMRKYKKSLIYEYVTGKKRVKI